MTISSVMAKSTYLVTVTYGDRVGFVEKLIDYAINTAGLAKVILVNNGSICDMTVLASRWNENLSIVDMGGNTGSAAGYSEGIKRAIEMGAEYIWLMDDDNLPRKCTYESLMQSLLELKIECGELCCVTGFRPDHQVDVAQGVSSKHRSKSRSSFFGFDIKKIPFKIMRRVNPKLFIGKIDPIVNLPFAPYGGLLASKGMFSAIGLPKCDMVLYTDDIEYTYRITGKGGVIRLITSAVIDDQEQSWSVKREKSNIFSTLINQGSDLRVYYSCRNQAWFDSRIWRTSRLEYALNALVFMFILAIYSIVCFKVKRFFLIVGAVFDGLKNRLGVNERFPL